MDQSGAINVKVRATKSHLNWSLQMRPIHTIGPKHMFYVFRNVWVHLGPFRYCTKLGAKWAELV